MLMVGDATRFVRTASARSSAWVGAGEELMAGTELIAYRCNSCRGSWDMRRTGARGLGFCPCCGDPNGWVACGMLPGTTADIEYSEDLFVREWALLGPWSVLTAVLFTRAWFVPVPVNIAWWAIIVVANIFFINKFTHWVVSNHRSTHV